MIILIVYLVHNFYVLTIFYIIVFNFQIPCGNSDYLALFSCFLPFEVVNLIIVVKNKTWTPLNRFDDLRSWIAIIAWFSPRIIGRICRKYPLKTTTITHNNFVLYEDTIFWVIAPVRFLRELIIGSRNNNEPESCTWMFGTAIILQHRWQRYHQTLFSSINLRASLSFIWQTLFHKSGRLSAFR